MRPARSAYLAAGDTTVGFTPTSALDLKNQKLILDWIVRLARTDGMTVVLTTHHPHHALAVADEALLMLGPEQFAHGVAYAVLTEANLHALYGVEIRKLQFEHSGHTLETLVPVLDLGQNLSGKSRLPET